MAAADWYNFLKKYRRDAAGGGPIEPERIPALCRDLTEMRMRSAEELLKEFENACKEWASEQRYALGSHKNPVDTRLDLIRSQLTIILTIKEMPELAPFARPSKNHQRDYIDLLLQEIALQDKLIANLRDQRTIEGQRAAAGV